MKNIIWPIFQGDTFKLDFHPIVDFNLTVKGDVHDSVTTVRRKPIKCTDAAQFISSPLSQKLSYRALHTDQKRNHFQRLYAKNFNSLKYRNLSKKTRLKIIN